MNSFLLIVNGSWLKAHGSCLKAHGSWPIKKSARARGLGDPAATFLLAMSLQHVEHTPQIAKPTAASTYNKYLMSCFLVYFGEP